MKAILCAALATAVLLLPTVARTETHDDLAGQVREAETAFAQCMAERNLEAFASFLDDEAMFFGDDSVLRGKDAVVAGWKPYFEGDAAPFSWVSESVEVLPSGTLAYSSGPVFIGDGRQVGVFNSVWRRNDAGAWKVVFDKGCQLCE